MSHKLHFAVGATAPGGNTIKSIVGQSDAVLVYKAEDGPRQDELGSALFNALTADSEESALKAFGPARARIQRIASIPVDPLESGWVIRYQGASRILMGVLFAAFLIAAAKANRVAGLVASSTAALLAYSFVCGFSERFVPEMLGGLEKSLLSSKGGRQAAAAHK